MRNLFGGDPYFDRVALLLPLRSHLRDESKAPNVITVTGDTKIVDGAAYFDGSNDELSSSNNTAYAIASRNFTIETWVKIITFGDYGRTIISKRSSGLAGWVLGITPEGQVAIRGIINSTWSESHIATANGVVLLNTWTHIAWTRVGTSHKIFVNGVLAAAQTIAGDIQDENTALRIGTANNAYENPLYGFLAGLRFTKGIARYTSNFTPPASLPTHGVAALNRRVPIALSEAKSPPFLARRPALSGGDPYFNNVVLNISGHGPLWSTAVKDISIFNRTVTVGGNAQIVTPSFTGIGSLYFDGSGDYVQVADSTSLELGAENFTIEFWFNVYNNTTTYINLLSKGWADVYSPFLFYASVTTGSEVVAISFFASTSGTGWDISSLALGTVKRTEWAHVAAVRCGNKLRLFTNGRMVSEATISGALTDNTYAVRAGMGASTEPLQGHMSDIRITKGVARYGGDFSPPKRGMDFGVPNLTTRIPTYMKSESARAPVLARRTEQGGDPYFNNVVLHVPYLTHGQDVSLYNKNGSRVTAAGNYTRVKTGGVFGGGCGYWDGQDDPSTHLAIADAVDWHWPGKFTLEFWIRPLGYKSNGAWLFGQIDTTQGFAPVRLTLSSTGTITLLRSSDNASWISDAYGAPTVAGTAILTTNVWAHVALADDGTTVRCFINGKLEFAVPTWTRVDSSSSFLIGGGYPTGDREFYGYMDDIRITKGVCRYNVPFSVPTRTHPQHGVPSRPVTAFAAPASPVSAALSAIYQDALLQWALSGSVYREAPYQWNTLNSALRAAQADWHLVNAAQRDATSQWNTIAAAYRDAVLNWNAAGQVLRAAGFDWGLLSTAERTAQADWHLVNAAFREMDLDWNTIAAAVRDGTFTWEQSGSVLRSANLNWNAIVSALRSGDVNWHLVNAAQRDAQFDWHSIAAALREAVLGWESAGAVARSASLTWNELSTAQRDAVAQWIVAVSVDRPASLQWLLLTSAQRSAAMRWELLKAVERDRTLSWHKIGYVLRDNQLDWSMLEHFIHEGHIDWNLANSAEAQAELAWGLVQAAERDAEVRFNLATAAFADAETAWNILSAAVRDVTARWDLIGAVLRSMDASWDTIMGVSRDSEAAWNVAIVAAQQLESAWNALGHAAKDAVIQWEKVGYTDRGIEVAWKIIPLYGSDGPPEYTVLITAENRAVSIEFESRSREVPAELRTLRVPPADDDTYGKL